ENAMYADPDLASGEARDGRIDARAFARARRLIEKALRTSDDDFERWFGSFMTEPKPWLECEPPDDALDADTMRALLADGRSLLRDSRARLAWADTDDGCLFFVNGDCRKLPASAAGLLARLCTTRRLE